MKRPSKSQNPSRDGPPKLTEGSVLLGPIGIEDLKPAPYNPRRIDAASARGLAKSLGEFGDISGLVWNARTGNLVAGHQRLDALKKEHGEALRMDGGAVLTPTGEWFPVRVVDWPVAKEKAANLAANSPFLAGSFTPDGLEDVLADLKGADGLDGLVQDLRLGELLPAFGDLLSVPAVEPGEGLTHNTTFSDGEGATETGTGGEWITFSVPLTHAQHATVMEAIRQAKNSTGQKLADGLERIAQAYLKESAHA